MFNREECLEILRKMLTDNVNYPFDGEQAVPDIETFIDKVLSEADSLYMDEYHYREYPEFKDFLYSHEVDTIAYSVHNGDIE